MNDALARALPAHLAESTTPAVFATERAQASASVEKKRVDLAALRRKVVEQAYGLGITLYLDAAGRVSQDGPGEAIVPPPSGRPTEGGHGKYAEAQAKP